MTFLHVYDCILIRGRSGMTGSGQWSVQFSSPFQWSSPAFTDSLHITAYMCFLSHDTLSWLTCTCTYFLLKYVVLSYCRFEHMDIIKLLIDVYHCSPDVRDNGGWTPLHYACKWVFHGAVNHTNYSSNYFRGVQYWYSQGTSFGEQHFKGSRRHVIAESMRWCT